MKNTDNSSAKARTEALDALRKAIEAAVGKPMSTAHDFERLSDTIYEKLQQRLSVNTLKRVWGYLDNDVQPRDTTLDILAMFIDFKDWNEFASTHVQTNRPEETATDPAHSLRRWSPKKKRLAVLVTACLLLLIALAAYGLRAFIQRNTLQHEDDSKYIIRMGERFPTHESYLSRLGINPPNPNLAIWSQTLPGLPHNVVAGFEYHHPHWGNEGNPDSLMPFITERWAPADADSELIAMRNTDRYYMARRANEFYIIFMKNLPVDSNTVDSSFVFCGVYRMSLEQSDTTQIVWERVAEEIDLRYLDYLERFRN